MTDPNNLNELVARLTKIQPVAFDCPEKSAKALKESIDRNYVHVLFTKTGTELGFTLDKNRCRMENASWTFPKPSGSVHIEGALILNYDKVRCIADIDIASCEGTGQLEPIGDEEYKTAMNRSR